MARGGKREGSGRKPIDKSESKAIPSRSIRCTDEEYEQIKLFLKQLRDANKKSPQPKPGAN